jgi:hypothetical protein
MSAALKRRMHAMSITHNFTRGLLFIIFQDVPANMLRSDVMLRPKPDQVVVLYLGDFMWGVRLSCFNQPDEERSGPLDDMGVQHVW